MSNAEEMQDFNIEFIKLEYQQLMTEMLAWPPVDSDLDELLKWKEIMAYKGFDPAELVVQMRQQQPDERALAEDVSMLIVEFLKTGRKSGDGKMYKKTKKEIIESKRLTKFYGITKDSSDRVSITLRRVAIAFAPMTIRLLIKNKIDRALTDTELSAIAGNSLPWCIRTQIYLCTLPASDSPTIAPHKAVYKMAIKATLCCSHLQSKVLNTKGRKKSWIAKDHMNDVVKYGLISIKSEHLSEKERLDVWTETMPSLVDGQESMERLIQKVELEVPEFTSMFERSFGPFIS